MKKFLILSAFCATLSFAADANSTDANATASNVEQGKKLYAKCIACHGAKADKKFMNTVPALNSIPAEERLQAMLDYKAGKLNKYKKGAMMKMQVSKLSEEDLKSINDYISTLK